VVTSKSPVAKYPREFSELSMKRGRRVRPNRPSQPKLQELADERMKSRGISAAVSTAG
jgi:hypothetical protein